MDDAYEKLNDVLEDGCSDCCSAKVYNGICADCKEHCDTILTEDEMKEAIDTKESDYYDLMNCHNV